MSKPRYTVVIVDRHGFTHSTKCTTLTQARAIYDEELEWESTKRAVIYFNGKVYLAAEGYWA